MTGERGSWRTVTEAIAAVQLRPFLSLLCCAKTDHIALGGGGVTFPNAQIHWAVLKDAKTTLNSCTTLFKLSTVVSVLSMSIKTLKIISYPLS